MILTPSVCIPARFAKEKLPKFIAKAYEADCERLAIFQPPPQVIDRLAICAQEKPDAEEALKSAFEVGSKTQRLQLRELQEGFFNEGAGDRIHGTCEDEEPYGRGRGIADALAEP